MSSRKCATICHISLICDMPLFIYKSKPHGNGPAAMKKDTIDKLIGRPGSIRIMKSYLARSDKGNAGKIFRHAVILPPPPEPCPAANARQYVTSA